jgi:hypothetical protein
LIFHLTDYKTRTNDLTKGQGGYFYLQTENTTDFNSIATDHMDPKSVNNENSADYSI